jgi:hypothetical protein
MIIILRTNNYPEESSYVLYNQWDEVVFQRDNFTQAATIHRDTIELSSGCYTFHLKDSDDDGLGFFANDDGSGYCKLDRVGGFDFESFERDFGKEIIHRFRFETSNATQVNSLIAPKVRIYPNPAQNSIQIDAIGFGSELTYNLYDSFGRKLESKKIARKREMDTIELSISHLANGIYYIELNDGLRRGTHRLIKGS